MAWLFEIQAFNRILLHFFHAWNNSLATAAGNEKERRKIHLAEMGFRLGTQWFRPIVGNALLASHYHYQPDFLWKIVLKYLFSPNICPIQAADRL